MATSITSEKLVIVEGKDEVEVLQALLPFIGIDNLQVIACGGNIKFKQEFLALIKTPGFIDVTSYGIMQDADDNVKSTFDRILYTLKKTEQPAPKTPGEFCTENGVKVGIYLFPGKNRQGVLEDMFLETLEETPVKKMADVYIGNLQERCPHTSEKGRFGISPRVAKSKVLSVLAATTDPCNKLGIAAKQGYWDFSHPAMRDLINFLKAI